MTRVRAKCAVCHKTFRASPKQTMCEDCERKARAASKAAIAKPAVSAAPMAPPKITGPGAGILDPRLKVTAASALPPAEIAHHDGRDTHAHDVASHHGSSSGHERGAERPRGGEHGPSGKHDRLPAAPGAPKQPREPRPKREPKPPTPAFEVTEELRQRIETRYLELAQPEFDGIRTQLAQELSVPKQAVKRVVRELRTRQHLPSWWDLQAYTGTAADLERIRVRYAPLLPVPDVGVHKHLAAELHLEERVVYQGIRRIRAEMHLPQYNPPESHGVPNQQSTEPAAAAGPAIDATNAAP